jgi:hypothetical protein
MNLCVLIPAKDERLGTGKTVQSVLEPLPGIST